MATPSAWADFDTHRHNVKTNTVDRLKQILTGFNDECGTNLTKGGKKQDLIDRITRALDTWRATNDTDKWTKARTIMQQVRQPRSYSSSSYTGDHTYTTSAHHASFQPSGSSNYSHINNAGSSSEHIPRYNPYAPPRRPTVPSTTSQAAPAAAPPSIRFKASPFFRVDRAVSSVVECPESGSAVDRRQQTLMFTLSNDALQKLSTPEPKYQLRLYCTSSMYWTQSGGFKTATMPCPIEFPPTCEVRVNGTALSANLKGMKKKPGTAPPPDLGKLLRTTPATPNRIEMVYVNSQQPAQPKKYYLVVMLVEVTTVEQLIDRLKKGKYKSKQEIFAKMFQSSSEDDDIVAGHQKMSLKCPLSYMRIQTPTRSVHCVHPQCFDAMSWFSVMEQTTTWLCPVCEKVLNPEELIIDGYFDEILKHTPEDVEDVIVEPDGDWHTADNKHGSEKWKAAHAPVKPVQPKPASPVKKRSSTPQDLLTNRTNGSSQSRPSNAEIVILDSDDEDEGRVKRELSPSFDGMAARGRSSMSSVSQPPRSATQSSDVIDLTLDTDDDEPPARPAPAPAPMASLSTAPVAKRKAPDAPSPTEQIWKKSRGDGPGSSSPASGASAPATSTGHRNGLLPLQESFPLPRPGTSQAHLATASGSTRYQPSYSPNSPTYPQYMPLTPSAQPPRRLSGNTPRQPYASPMDGRYANVPHMNGATSSSPESWRT
ncbi:hypothetical protein CERSUDRAFT_110664 [Gelatoporia subvermispora B]|uniref:SP-RING-type domain-containing protein n=1 Tax=Ceriporiopsis subvermispora (strain B) TaxID=914234 RepID=M2QY99_CERS8|nr:hypothetical protein CERSUDRAFT_110664 [Gelatoporia subvermispora B]